MEPMTALNLSKPLIKSLFQKFVENIIPTKFAQSLEKAVDEWAIELPAELQSGFEPRAVLRGLKPEPQHEQKQEENACWDAIHALLADNTVPKQSDWYDALQKRWKYVNATNQDSEQVFRVDPVTRKPLLESLARKLESACANNDALYKPTTTRALAAIASKLDDLGQAIEERSSPHDVSLDHVKELVERHELSAAKVMLDQLDSEWGTLTPWQQYRVTALRANAVYKDGDYSQAGRLFIRAKTFQPTLDKAIINEAVGYELVGEVHKAHELASHVRREYPDSAHAMAVWLRTLPKGSDIASLVKSIPAALLKDQEVLAAVVSISTREEQKETAVTFAGRLNDASQDWPAGILAIAQALHMAGFNVAKGDERNPLLREALATYTRAADLAKKRNDKQIESVAILNRGILREFFGEPGSTNDFEAAALLRPDDPMITRRRDLLLLQNKEYDIAVSRARTGYENARGPDTALFLALALAERKQPADVQEAIRLSSAVAKDPTAGNLCSDALTLAITLFVEQKHDQPALDLIRSCESHLSPMVVATIKSILFKDLGNVPDATIVAESAFTLFKPDDPRADRHRLALHLANLGMHDKAATVFKTLVRHGLFDSDMKMLLLCAQKADNDQLLLSTMEELREAGVRDQRLLHNEVALLRRYNPEKAAGILAALIQENPSNKYAQLYRSLLGIQLRRDEYICTDPSLLPSVDEGDPPNTGRFVIGVLLKAGKLEEAIRYAYRLLRMHLDDVTAHRAYMNVFYHHSVREGNIGILQPSSSVEVGSAAEVVELVSGRRYWIIIEDQLPICERLDEYLSSHPLAQAVLGKKLDEVFDLTESDLQPRQAKVIGILSKYVRLYHYCLTNFEIQFKAEHDIQMFHVPQTGSGDDARPDFSVIETLLRQHHDQAAQILGLYPTVPVPLWKLSELLGKALYDVLTGLCQMPDKGIVCCSGTIEEREDAFNILLDAREVVFEATAIFTLIVVDRINVVERWPARPIISQATLELIEEYVEDRLMEPEEGYCSLDSEGRLIRVRADPVAVQENADRFKNALEIVKRCCTVVPCDKLAAIDPAKRKFIVEWFGQHGAESVILASEPGRLLWTDDHVLAMHSKGDFGARTVWSQVGLQAAVYQKVLQQSEMDSASARLFGAGYSYTWWNPDVLLCAAAMVNWNPESSLLSKFVEGFADRRVDFEMRFPFAVRSIIQFYQSPASGPLKNRFVVLVLDAVSKYSDRKKVYTLMRYYVERICQDNAQLVWDLLTVTKIWFDWRELCEKPLDMRSIKTAGRHALSLRRA